MSESRDLTGGQPQSMISHRTRKSEAILDHVEPVHLVLRAKTPGAES